ncbi:endonuclease-reverse transcriptase [Clonorchis sinensis]|uniref:Endonuclease-reverse transcriptase n=1 Tax=Clonorchis sinensis TaxID=79923 RepID=G7Y2X8_CLOSI|nr:endonuclease-reverse transcriptase [Clonorchis sinensis]
MGPTCEECGKCCKSKAGLVAHHRVHDNHSVEADDYGVWFKQTVDCAVSLLESHADSSLASVDLLAFVRGLQSGIMTPEQVLSLLDLNASGTVPHTWKTVSRRRRQLTHRMPVNRKQIRRASYAAIRTLYHQRREDAASAVLHGSWKDLYKGNCGLPLDTGQYWKQVLSAPKHVDSRPSRVVVPSDWSLIEPITESQARLKEGLEAAAVELGKAGTKINARKTKAMVICGDRKHRVTAVPVEPFYFAEELITPLESFLGYFSAVSSSDATCSGRELEALDMVTVARRSYVVETVANRRVWCIFRIPARSRMPDLIAIRERRVTVIDVSIVSDGRGVTVWNGKKQKYGADDFSLAIISALRATGCDVHHDNRGICLPQSAKTVIGLGLPKGTVMNVLRRTRNWKIESLQMWTTVGDISPLSDRINMIDEEPHSRGVTLAKWRLVSWIARGTLALIDVIRLLIKPNFPLLWEGQKRNKYETDIIVIDGMTTVFNTDASLPYNHASFEILMVKKRIKVDGEGT